MLEASGGGGGGSPTLNIASVDYVFDPSVYNTAILTATQLQLAQSYVADLFIASANVQIGHEISSTNVITLTGLSSLINYRIIVTAYSGPNGTGTAGNSYAITLTVPSNSNNSGVKDTTSGDLFNSTVPTSGVSKIYNKTLYSLTNNSTSKTHYEIAYKSFSALTSSTPGYYSFGTTLFMDDNNDYPNQGGGLGFFVSDGGSSMYLLKIDTTSRSASINTKKEISIWKVLNDQFFQLTDSQTTDATSVSGIYGGRSYKIDIKVKSDGTKNYISVYVNGFKITATDDSKLVPFSNKVAMVCSYGTMNFDYIYAMTIDSTKYSQDGAFNVYTGQYSNSLLKFLFGDTIVDLSKSTTSISGSLEEFGPVAREIRKSDIRFDSRPGYPLYPSTGINQFAAVLGARMSPFGAQVYVMNNSGTFIPLDDGDTASFHIGGLSLTRSGVMEYTDMTSNEYTTEEPVIFQSTWLQNLSDVKNLGDWIKTQWSKKQGIVSMSVFGQPLISVGDIINIKYTYQGLQGTEKFIVTNVNQSYNAGLETSIVCRTL